MEPFICPWDTTYLFVSESVPPLLYYSHIPAVAVALMAGLFVFFSSRQSTESKILLFLLALFSSWAITDLFLWSNNRTDLTMFWWSIQILTELIIYAVAFFLLYYFIYRQFLKLWQLTGLVTLLLPAVLLMPTSVYLLGIDEYCVPEENPLIVYFSYGFEVLIILVIVLTTYYSFVQKKSKADPKASILFSIGIIFFLVAFTSGNIIGSLTDNWDLAQFGLFGMPIFIAFVAYLIVEYKIFNVKLIAAQALTIAIIVLVGSMLFFSRSTINIVLICINLVLVSIGGYFLVRSVKREVKQREQLEVLTQELERANVRLKELDKLKSEFVSIASHQLRSPLTSIRGYASMLLEGSYGKLSEKAQDAVERIAESSRMMALSVEDYLNVSRIQAGNMKYNYSDFNLADMASKIVDDIRRDAVKKGLVLSYKSDLHLQGIVNADNGKTMQILHNLINNAIKYTPKGTVTVFAHDQGKKLHIDIIDSGIGLSKESIAGLFAKFERAKNANEVNVTGTGLGLYVAQTMAKEMKGNIEVFSDGEGKGSTFRFTLPVLM